MSVMSSHNTVNLTVGLTACWSQQEINYRILKLALCVCVESACVCVCVCAWGAGGGGNGVSYFLPQRISNVGTISMS